MDLRGPRVQSVTRSSDFTEFKAVDISGTIKKDHNRDAVVKCTKMFHKEEE